MRYKILWLGFLVAGALALIAGSGSEAQPPPGKGFPGGKGFKGPKGPAVTVDYIVERIMSFDKNGDGKVTADELPERMQHLIAMGDTNKDGVLDKEEVRALAVTLEALGGLLNGGGPPGGKGPPNFVRAVDDLELQGDVYQKATKIAREQQDKLRKYDEEVRTDMLAQMKEILRDPDYRAFKAAIDFPPPKGKGKKGDF
jgi:hypothetical protein